MQKATQRQNHGDLQQQMREAHGVYRFTSKKNAGDTVAGVSGGKNGIG